MSKLATRLLPQTPWQAKSLWSVETKPMLVLIIGLIFFGIAEGMLVLSQLGATPWAVFAQGLARQLHINMGWTTLLISIVVLLSWIPLHLRLGLGTVANMILIALALGVFVAIAPVPQNLWLQIAYCVGGIVLMGVAAAFYLTTHLGAGPRDGLMVGLCQVTGWRVGIIRTLMESTVCLIGWAMGGTWGVGTLLFAFSIGWVLQTALNQIARYYPQN